MNLKKNEDEIDLLDLISVILQNKYKILLTTLIPTVLISIYLLYFQKPDETKFQTSTEIMPISTFEELRYKEYNSHISYLIYNTGNVNNILSLENDSEIQSNIIEYSSIFNKVTKDYLLNLFRKIDDTNFKIGAIKNINL